MNKLKKLAAIFLSIPIITATTGNLCDLNFKTVSAENILGANEITEEMGAGWNLGNSLDSTGFSNTSAYKSGNYDITRFEKYWGNPVVTKDLIDAVKAKGFDTIRIPTTWYENVTVTENENGKIYTINEKWLNRVKEVVDYAYENDMYVILNLHHEEWINRSDFPNAYDEMSEKLKQLWTQIATFFADYDQHLIFEGMNEPRQTGTTWEWSGNADCYNVVNKLNNDFVNTVRSIDSAYKDTRLLMIPSYAASGDSYIYGNLDIPENDDYIAVSVHAYKPYEFTMADSSMSNQKYDHSIFNDYYKKSLDQTFKDLQRNFTDNDIPVVIGEFSASNYNNVEARVDWMEYYMTWAKKLGIPCVIWDNNTIQNSNASESHGYINRSSLTWYEASEPVIDKFINIVDDSNIIWGAERHLPTYIHSNLNDGNILTSKPEGVVLDASNDTGVSGNFSVDSSILNENTEIAIEFKGDVAPTACFMDNSWGGWTEVSPYEVDKEKGIAYYSYNDIKSAWSGDVSNIAHLCFKTTSSITYYTISILPAATIQEEKPSIIKGDINNDKLVNIFDLSILKYKLGKGIEVSNESADLNDDNAVTLTDTVLLQKLLLGSYFLDTQ